MIKQRNILKNNKVYHNQLESKQMDTIEKNNLLVNSNKGKIPSFMTEDLTNQILSE